MIEQSMIGELMSTGECAKEMGLHPNTVRRYIKSGRLKAFLVGRNNFRIRREDLKTFWESLKYESETYQASISNQEAPKII